MIQSIFKFDEWRDYTAENFLASPSNSQAFNYIKNFPWDFYALSIHGPTGSGKTHLAKILSRKSNVHIIDDVNLETDQQDLLHLLNHIKENNQFALLTSEFPLKTIGFTLPDLVSRLSAINSVHIDKPDNELFYLLFARHFASRQLKVSDEVINYLAARVERCFTAAQKVVEQIDRLSLEQKRNITIPLIKDVVFEYAS